MHGISKKQRKLIYKGHFPKGLWIEMPDRPKNEFDYKLASPKAPQQQHPAN
ncbi:MAG: hypothetical protein HLUCCX10_06145 [Algoriphagus marincola HL-49]|uniref:Uncharacterized protein n=1 Tax=Algoriphagus marincola HL-49 TaxID=1305737 RepID=A0A0P7XLV1_9BACT|nr:MAG: hypothetical protein HLUCCX10_06145 [Algoriphagus marincola HL-49]